MAVSPKVINVDAWSILKTVFVNDLIYWKGMEQQLLLDKNANEFTIRSAIAVASTSVGLTEYYMDLMDKIEKGEITASGASTEES